MKSNHKDGGENMIKVSGFDEGTSHDYMQHFLKEVFPKFDPDSKYEYDLIAKKYSDFALLKFKDIDFRRQLNQHFHEKVHNKSFVVGEAEVKLFLGAALFGDAVTKQNATRVFLKACTASQSGEDEHIPESVKMDKDNQGNIYANGLRVAYVTVQNGLPKINIVEKKAEKAKVTLEPIRDVILEAWH